MCVCVYICIGSISRIIIIINVCRLAITDIPSISRESLKTSMIITVTAIFNAHAVPVRYCRYINTIGFAPSNFPRYRFLPSPENSKRDRVLIIFDIRRNKL